MRELWIRYLTPLAGVVTHGWRRYSGPSCHSSEYTTSTRMAMRRVMKKKEALLNEATLNAPIVLEAGT